MDPQQSTIQTIQSPPQCHVCHTQIRTTDYFCFNCGANLHPKPRSTSLSTQIGLYLGSVVLPPMGLIWGFRYLREQSQTGKIIGVVCIILTIITLLAIAQGTISAINMINEEINRQLPTLQGF